MTSANSKVALLNKLRKLSEPDAQGVTVGFHGSTMGAGQAVAPEAEPMAPAGPGDRVVYESKLSSFIQNTMDVTTQTVLSADRRSLRTSMAPVFNTLTDADPRVSSSVIPGAPQP